MRHQQDIWVFDKSFLDSVLGLLRSGYVNVIHKALHLKVLNYKLHYSILLFIFFFFLG